MQGIAPNSAEHLKVEFIDTGVDPIHPNQDFRNALWSDPNEGTDMGADLNNNCQPGDKLGWNFVDDNNLPLDYHSHGTHVAGIIYKNSGCAPVKLLTAKALDNKGLGLDIDIACAIHYGIKQQVNVICMSLGRAGTPSTIVEKAVQKAVENDIVVVAAAGNYVSDNDAVPMWPANFPDVISVNAHQAGNTANLWVSTTHIGMGSNTGSRSVHIATEGENVYSTIPGGYQRKSGTSMAAPQVAAAAIVQKSHQVELSASEIRNKIFVDGLLKEHYNQQNYNMYGVLSPDLYCNTPFPDEAMEVTEMTRRPNRTATASIAALTIAPNPITDVATITIDYQGQESMAEIIVTDLVGNIVLQKKVALTGKTTQESLIINELPNGIYLTKILIGKTILSKKIVKF
jgi:subtilisin family serine protease